MAADKRCFSLLLLKVYVRVLPVLSLVFLVVPVLTWNIRWDSIKNLKSLTLQSAFFCCCQFWGWCFKSCQFWHSEKNLKSSTLQSAFFVVASVEVGVLSVASFKVRPEVIDTAEGLLRVDHVEVDDRVHTDRHRVPRQNLVFKKISQFQFNLLYFRKFNATSTLTVTESCDRI